MIFNILLFFIHFNIFSKKNWKKSFNLTRSFDIQNNFSWFSRTSSALLFRNRCKRLNYFLSILRALVRDKLCRNRHRHRHPRLLSSVHFSVGGLVSPVVSRPLFSIFYAFAATSKFRVFFFIFFIFFIFFHNNFKEEFLISVMKTRQRYLQDKDIKILYYLLL